MALEETQGFEGSMLSEMSAINQRLPILTVLAGESAGLQFPLNRPAVVIGRGAECDLQLTDVGVSRRHAQITVFPDRVVLKDLNSTNGTYVSGQRVSEHQLRDDDKIVLGPNAILCFHLTDSDEGKLQAKLYNNATRDPVTELYNARLFQDFLEAELAYSQRHEQELSLLLLVVDNFQELLLTHGHAAGDSLLKGLAGTVQQVARNEDLTARMGESMFALLLRRCALEHACTLAERLRWAVEKIGYRAITREGEKALRVTVSVAAVGRKVTSEASPESLLQVCNETLLKAKQAGGNRVLRGEV